MESLNDKMTTIEFCGYPSHLERMVKRFHYGHSKLIVRGISTLRDKKNIFPFMTISPDGEVVTYYDLKIWKAKSESLKDTYCVCIPFENAGKQLRALSKIVIDLNLIMEPIKLNGIVVTTSRVGLAIVGLQCCKGGEIANMLIDMANDKLIS